MKKLLRRILPHSIKVVLKEKMGTSVRMVIEEQNVIVSFPKCGRSWLRIMLTDYVKFKYNIQDEYFRENELSSLHKDLPNISFSHDDWPCFKKYDELETEKKHYSKRNVVFLYRNPIDVTVSWYYQLKDRGSIKWMPSGFVLNDLDSFVKDDIGSLKSITQYFNIWFKEHYDSSNVLLVNYEGLKENPIGTLEQIMLHLGFKNVDSNLLMKVVDDNSFESLKKKEASGEIKDPGFKQKGAKVGMKVRKGKVKGYLSELQEDTVRWAEKYVNENLDSRIRY